MSIVYVSQHMNTSSLAFITSYYIHVIDYDWFRAMWHFIAIHVQWLSDLSSALLNEWYLMLLIVIDFSRPNK